MPSHHLIRQFADLFEVEKEWRWSGEHYRRTALDWLKKISMRIVPRSKRFAPRVRRRHEPVAAALALVLPRYRRTIRLRRRQRMGRQPLPDEGGVFISRSHCGAASSFPSPLVGEGGFAKRRRVRGLSPRRETPCICPLIEMCNVSD
jgi:hypothetical protein